MALQLVIGAVVAGLVTIKIYWHRLSSFLGRKSEEMESNNSDLDKTKN